MTTLVKQLMNPMTSALEVNKRVRRSFGLSLACFSVMTMVSLFILSANEPTADRPAILPRAAVEEENRAGSDQATEYNKDAPKTILELQQFRQTTSIPIRSAEGREGEETLINLNPTINVWYVLKVAWNGVPEVSYHLENPAPLTQKLVLDEKFPSGIVIVEQGERHPCSLLGSTPANTLDQAASSRSIFAPLCEARLYLRNQARGQRTALEAGTEFLRNQVWGGEKVIDLFHHLMDNAHRETAKVRTEARTSGDATAGHSNNLPVSALIDAQYADRVIASGNLGIAADGADKSGLRPGAWYPASGNPGIYISLLQPNFVDPRILQSYRKTVSNLDSTEASSLCYLVALDLDQFDLAYALGTEHPGVGWSEHIAAQIKDPRLAGPDGIGSISPIVSTGLVSPNDARRTVATFTGGFKREHGAFRYGELAQKNHGSHYGFIEDGVVFSKLQPGLATVLILDDGQAKLKTWEERDNQLLARIRYARQNGVPLVEYDEASRSTVPGALVSRWGPGNWSGSEDMKLRTIRAGVALQQRDGKRFLIYAVFSDATPSAMARIFQAYQCQYALLLDMNALEHTYLAVYRTSGSQLIIDHLIRGMSQVEKSASGQVVPRFLGYPDNRDFFYLMRRNP